jgi:signal transduction histidine kinase
MRNVARTGVPFIAKEFEFQGFRRGKTYWNLAYVPIGTEGRRDILVTAIEVTEQVNVRLRTEEERVRLQIILDSLPVGVSVADANGRILIRNKQMNNVLGDEPLSEGISDYGRFQGYHPGTDTPLQPEEWPMARSLLKGETVINEELDMIGKDGTRRTVLSSSMPMRDKNGRLTSGLAVFTDITMQKKLEGRLKRSNAELQQFAYVASHDLQEPLRMVTSYIGLLNKKYGDELDGQAKTYMAYAVDGAERMRELIDDLLQYSRIDTQGIEFSNVDMNVVAKKVINTVHVAILESKANVSVKPLPTVCGDATQLSQVLQNLISNAIKFHGPEAPRIEVASRESATGWTISVKDNGVGIDVKYHDKLFQMFQRLHTREEYPGTGIGLAISKKIVERHGGRIWVESDGMNGSTFYFTIPIRT